MSELRNHPLNGINLETLLGELVRHYGWEVLGEQININCFKSYPSFQSSMKYLRKTEWARHKLEAFYLYRFLQHPLPSDEQHALPPRNRLVDLNRLAEVPAKIVLGDPEYFDDPESGPVFPSKLSVQQTRSGSRRAGKKPREDQRVDDQNENSKSTPNPWGKWSK